jgi:hypothetical protein
MTSIDTFRADSSTTHATCPVCGRTCKILKGGQLSTHGGTALAWGSVQGGCKGSGAKTVTEALESAMRYAGSERDRADAERKLAEWTARNEQPAAEPVAEVNVAEVIAAHHRGEMKAAALVLSLGTASEIRRMKRPALEALLATVNGADLVSAFAA